MLRTAGSALDLVINIFMIAGLAILVALVLGVTYEVLARYVAGRPTEWVSEFSEYALLWLAFLSSAWVLREEGHVKVEMLTELLSAARQRQLHIATSLIGAAVSALFCWVSASYVIEVFHTGEILFKGVQLSKWSVMSVMPPGLALLALQFLRRAFTAPSGPAATGH